MDLLKGCNHTSGLGRTLMIRSGANYSKCMQRVNSKPFTRSIYRTRRNTYVGRTQCAFRLPGFGTPAEKANVELFRDQPEVWKFLVAPVALAVFAADLGTDPRHVGLTELAGVAIVLNVGLDVGRGWQRFHFLENKREPQAVAKAIRQPIDDTPSSSSLSYIAPILAVPLFNAAPWSEDVQAILILYAIIFSLAILYFDVSTVELNGYTSVVRVIEVDQGGEDVDGRIYLYDKLVDKDGGLFLAALKEVIADGFKVLPNSNFEVFVEKATGKDYLLPADRDISKDVEGYAMYTYNILHFCRSQKTEQLDPAQA